MHPLGFGSTGTGERMTGVIQRAEDQPSAQGPPSLSGGGRSTRRFTLRSRVIAMLGSLVVLAGVLSAVALAPSPTKKASPVKTITLASQSYRPQAVIGGTDDYHCTLLDPHVTRNSYIISSQFTPGSPEDHH